MPGAGLALAALRLAFHCIGRLGNSEPILDHAEPVMVVLQLVVRVLGSLGLAVGGPVIPRGTSVPRLGWGGLAALARALVGVWSRSHRAVTLALA